jgi:hypothetical protein
LSWYQSGLFHDLAAKPIAAATTANQPPPLPSKIFATAARLRCRRRPYTQPKTKNQNLTIKLAAAP